MARPQAAKTRRIHDFVLMNIPEHPRDITRLTAEHFGISRQAASAHLRTLIQRGDVEFTGSTRDRAYRVVQHHHRIEYPLAGLSEDVVWREWVQPLLPEDIPEHVYDICEYAFTEMLNNAIDHSEGSGVAIKLTLSPGFIAFRVSDNGIGIFRKIQKALNLADEKHAVLELSKGKLTTDPSRHSGEGIFFTSRMVDEFSLLAGGLFFVHSPADEESDWLLEMSPPTNGTLLTMIIDKRTQTRMQKIFDAFSDISGGTYAFDITHVPVRLAKVGDENLVSRSQAKRLVARFDRFKKVILDFEGVQTIGQAFADEIFRVFVSQHPDVQLSVSKASTQVSQMIARAQSLAAEQDDSTGK